jgi:hypothetical protein
MGVILMAIPVMNFEPEDSNIGRMLDRYGSMESSKLARQLAELHNQELQAKLPYVGPMQEQSLQKAIYENMIQKPYAQNASDFAMADLSQKKSNVGLTNAQIKEALARVPFINAQTERENFLTANPLLSLGGTAGQVGAIQYIQQHPELFGSTQNQTTNQSPNQSNSQIGTGLNNYSQMIRDSLLTQLQKDQSLAQLNTQRAQGQNYLALTPDQKNFVLAQGAGMGIEPTEMAKYLLSGKTVSDIAKEKGFDPNNLPEPIYALTPSGRTQLERRQQAQAEINVLDKKLTEAMAPYSRRVMGYSPKQIGEALSGTNDDTQAKFLAASALQPEMAQIRLRLGGGNVGIEAIRELTKSSMGHINHLQSTISPSVYKKAQEYMNSWLNEAANAANRAHLRGGSTANKTPDLSQLSIDNTGNQPTSTPKQKRSRYNIQTGQFERVE